MLWTQSAVALSFIAASLGQPTVDRPVGAVDKVLQQRVVEYWEARSKTNLVAAYAFYEPAFREQFPLDLFLSNFQRLLRFRPQFQGIDKIAIAPGGASATVHVRLRIRTDLVNGEIVDSVSEEKWLLIEGVWYRKGEATMPEL